MTDPDIPDRTVFQPGRPASFPPGGGGDGDATPTAPASEPEASPRPEPAPAPPAHEPTLVGVRPAASTPPSPLPEPTAAPAEPGLPPSAAAPGGFHAIPPGTYGRVEVGSVLNDIFQVTRFLARGGMGEVFEGVNVNTDERVAIKVILPALAQDPTVQAMFRKEARTLTRLQHPSLVQYRVLAQEPRLNVLYIVTEFIEGAALSDTLGRLRPSSEELRSLLRCLCEGLRAAHALGAIHRDLSPDNVLLSGERIDRAKIIDFGIAKDLDASSGTIVGDGFAGKLGYVAPEQFGDFGREIGPWTDVYSLGLTVLAVAAGRNVDMGSTLVEAVDRRRAGPDLSPLPEDLRPLFAHMLQADPARRLRSMDAVLAELDALEGRTVLAPGAPAPTAEPAPAPVPPPKANRTPLLVGAAAIVLLALGGGALALLSARHGPTPAAPLASAPAGGPAAARQAVAAALPYLGCTWLDLDGAQEGAGGLQLALKGVAGSPGQVQAAVSTAAVNSGARVADVNLSNVAPVEGAVCSALDAFRLVRDRSPGAAGRLTTARTVYPMTAGADGKASARAEIGIDVGDPSLDFALFGLEPDGKIDPILTSRSMAEGLVGGPSLKKTGADSYLLPLDTDHAGWSGLLLLRGKGPFDAALVAAPAAERTGAWPGRVKAAADAGGWSADMVWYKTTR